MDNGKDISWRRANKYAENLSLGGYSDWRLPTIEELDTLYDPEDGGECNVKKPFQLSSRWVWSSQREGWTSALQYNFYFRGGDRCGVGESDRRRALCVRWSGE